MCENRQRKRATEVHIRTCVCLCAKDPGCCDGFASLAVGGGVSIAVEGDEKKGTVSLNLPFSLSPNTTKKMRAGGFAFFIVWNI